MADEQWREQMREVPIRSCGRLDMATYMPEEVTLGRVTSDRVRYVYFEDGSEVICLGKFCDHVAFRAADWSALEAENARLRAQALSEKDAALLEAIARGIEAEYDDSDHEHVVGLRAIAAKARGGE